MATKWLIVKASGGGGLGDLIKSALVGALYAKLTNRTLVVDWSNSIYSEDKTNLFPEFFEIQNLDFSISLPDTEDIYPTAWNGRLGKSLHQVYTEDGWDTWDRAKTIDTYSFDMTNLDYKESVLVMWEFDQLPKILPRFPEHGSSSFNLLRYAFHNFFQIHPNYQDWVDSLTADFPDNILGVHIRATDEFHTQKHRTPLSNHHKLVKKNTQTILFKRPIPGH